MNQRKELNNWHKLHKTILVLSILYFKVDFLPKGNYTVQARYQRGREVHWRLPS